MLFMLINTVLVLGLIPQPLPVLQRFLLKRPSFPHLRQPMLLLLHPLLARYIDVLPFKSYAVINT